MMEIKFLYKFTLSISLTVMVIFIKGLAYTNAQTEPLDLLTSNDEEIQVLKSKIKSIESNVQFTEIPEINLLRIENPNKSIKDLVEHSEEVKLSGKLANNIQANNNSEKDIIKIDENLSISQKSNLENELLSRLTWHIDKLTDNKNSLNYSKGEGVKIALIDSGVDKVHPLLKNSIDLRNAKSFVTKEKSIEDTNGHGTMVAGIISQVSPKAKITPYRVLSSADGESIWTLKAMIKAIHDKQDIMNMSLGTYKSENIESDKLTIEAFKRVVNLAQKKNIIIISSSGNKSLNLDDNYNENRVLHLPGDLDGVITVSATNKDDKLASYSNIGTPVELAAPGGELIIDENGALDAREMIYTSYPLNLKNVYKEAGIPNGYTLTYGTSLSAAGISGIFANYYSYHLRELKEKPSVQEAVSNIAKSSKDLGPIGRDIQYGYGIPDSLKSYNLITE